MTATSTTSITTARRAAVGAVAVIIADQVTKAIAERAHPGSPVLPMRNRHYAVGIVGGNPVLLATGTIAVLVVLSIWQRRSSRPWPWWIVPLLMAGAASNLIDRLVLGAVRDFVPTPWIVFNLADVAIAIAIAGLYGHLIRCRRAVRAAGARRPDPAR